MNTFIFLSIATIWLFLTYQFLRKKLDEYVGKMLGAIVTRDTNGVWLEWPHLGFRGHIGVMGRLKMPVDDAALRRIVSNMTTEEKITFMMQSPAVAKTYAEAEGREATIRLIQQEKEYVTAERARAAVIGAYLGNYDHHLRQLDLTLKSLS